ncbi:glycosyltransferase [Roseibacterium sp. SDUM158016]|uniref:glycosyltransferase n=1 Tax=Roseicyclus sediminis TaxID=2980997 RepID=UPI0021CE8C2E|nr:glycosyltransferase [Roseibacterium sp. SDUM158016]MCU4652081.1 glycosyltransferase [Roseibacterium sp. SDUM158016]
MRSNVGAGTVRLELVELCSKGQLATAHLRLLDSGLDAVDHPGLWEFLERRFVEAGDALLAHRVRRDLLAAEVASTDIVLNEARYEIENNRPGRARTYIENAFGPDPGNDEARVLLGVALTSEDKERALRLLEGAATGTEAATLLAIDALRDIGELRRARRLCEAALERYPRNAMFSNRLGWIAEGTGDFETAISIVSTTRAGDIEGEAQALNRLVRIHRRLGDRAATIAHAADLLRLDARPTQKLRLARALGQPRLLEHLVSLLPAQFARAEVTGDEAGKVIGFLLEQGYVGLAVFLWQAGLPIAPAEKLLLERFGFGVNPGRQLPQSFDEALSIRSPDILFPLYPECAEATPQAASAPVLRDSDRVLLVNSVLSAGGAERQFLMVARSLVAAGLSPDRLHAALFSMEGDRGHDHFEAELRATGIHVHDLSREDISKIAMRDRDRDIVAMLPARLSTDVLPLWRLVQRLEPAVVHGWQDRASIAAGLVGRMLEVERTVLSVRNMRPRKRGEDFDWVPRSVYRELLASPSVAITANSFEGARDYEDWLGLAGDSLSVLSNAIDEAVFKPRSGPRQPGGPIRILGVFRLTENKRPILWLETIAALRASHAVEIAPRLVGAGPMADEVRRSAARLGLDDLTIEAPLPDPSDIYRSSDVLLLMSSVEGTPNVVLEAQACGLPVAACQVGGVQKAMHLDGEDAGLLLDADVGAADAAGAIAAWLPEALAAPGKARVDFIRRNYSMQALARNLLGLYGART